jgi:hypothetical protein
MGGLVFRRRLYLGACFAAVAFLAFVAGALVVQLRVWPYQELRNTLIAAKAAHDRSNHPGQYGWYFYGRARTGEAGVRRYDRERAYGDLTLFTSAHDHQAYLIDMQGSIVHRWHVPFARAWPAPKHLERVPPSEYVSLRDAHLFENGDLLALYEQGGGTPWGIGLLKMDAQSDVRWTYDGRAHHDFAVAEDGTIYALIHEVQTETPAGLEPRVLPPVLEDFVVVLSPEGEELRRVGVTEAIRNSSFGAILDLPKPTERGDLWHANDVEPLPAALAEAFPALRPGQVMVSLRSVDTLVIVDLERRAVVWAARGPWYRQHDPDFLPNGNLLVFDNRGHYGPGEGSRLVELDFASLDVVWSYAGTAADPFYTRGAGAQQRLPNGNTLVTESLPGRIFEVTAEGDVVWEYLSPFRAPHDPLLVGIVHRAKRFRADELRFELARGGGN